MVFFSFGITITNMVKQNVSAKTVQSRNFLTYLSVVKGSVNSRAFQQQWADVDGKVINIAKKGDVSCGFFVSFVLVGFRYISEIHATVSGVVRDLEKSGWKKILVPREGAIILWEQIEGKSGMHSHIGFWINSRKAISNSSAFGVPKIHHPTFGRKNGRPVRKISAIYWKKGIEKD